MDLSRYEFECQKALHQGLQYARSLGHQLLEVEHVVLAMLRAELLNIDAHTSDRLKKHIERHLARAPRVYGAVKIEFGKRLDRALDRVEAAAGPQVQVSIDLMWRGLQSESTVVRTFLARTAEPLDGNDPLSSTKASQAPKSEGAEFVEPPDVAATKDKSKATKQLERFTIDLTAKADRGELDPVIGRDQEVRRVLEILGRKKKNNPLLIGEPGVGKSAVAEAIALRIAEGRVPEPMRAKRVLSLDLGAMLAGAKYRGEFEDRMKNLIKHLDDLSGQVVLFIDEIHMIVGAGNQEGGADAANLLKPALARGELQCIGATTLAEFRRHIEKDAALERRFQPIKVEEPSPAVALSILRGIKSRYEIHHGVEIEDAALAAAVDLGVRYVPDRNLPDKAIDLLDEAASRMRLQIDSVPAILDELRSEIEQIEIERQALGDGKKSAAALTKLDVRLRKAKAEHERIEGVWRQHQDILEKIKVVEKRRQESTSLYDSARSEGQFDFAARIQYDELPRLSKEIDAHREELHQLQNDHSFLRQAVDARQIAEVVCAWTGVPIGKLIDTGASNQGDLYQRLSQRVYGQAEALRQVAKAIKRAQAGVHDPKRPLGVFLFLGPTGVGKTETAKALASELFNDESRIVRVDMSEFMEAHNVARLIGSPPGYVGFGEGGELTDRVRTNPYSIVLLDEMEKAHPKTLDILLQVFEDGRLTDGQGRTVDFRNTVVIMTSNLPLTGDDLGDEDIRHQLTHHLRPEFVNRIDEVIQFRQLANRQLDLLLDRLLGELNQRVADRQFRVSLSAELRQKLVSEAGLSEFGGRALRRRFQQVIVDEVSDRIIEHPDKAQGAWEIVLDEDGGLQWRREQKNHHYLPPAQ